LDRLTSSAASYPTRIREWWSAQAASTRLFYGAVAVAAVLALAFFAAFRLRGPDYAVLFSNMAPDEGNAVIQKLDAEKIPHRLADNGATILVPHEDVYEQRVQLAGQGIVKAGGGTGFELFDRTNLGMTDFQEKIAKTRATEGELQRTISGLTPVLSARVHIATPEASLYSTTQQPTTASVAIQTKPGMQLGAQEVRGITQLVAGAVEGLKPENVTIVDQNGTILRPSALDSTGTLGDASNALQLTQDQLIAKEKYESDLQQSLQGLLDVTIGAHRSAVRVATQMDFDANSTETESYAPLGTVRSQQSEREGYTGGAAGRNAAIGVPGTTTNVIPTYQGSQNQQGAGRYTKSKTTTNYEVTKALAKHVDAPGKVTRLSVAVLVNAPAASATGPNAQTAYIVSATDVAKIRNAVAAAAGIDPTRGDQVSVEAIPFALTPEAIAARSASTTVLGLPTVPFVALLVIAGIAAAGFGLAFVRRRTFRPSAELPTFDSSLAEELPSFEEHPMLDGSPSIAAPIRSAADLTREQMIEYVTTVAQENPDSIAKLVKLWLAE
jgi:flagellar M-ring protein FliF